jgi:fatty-acyl-CoA synthase
MRWETDWISGHARLTPEQIALIDGESKARITYRELNESASRIAYRLLQKGIKKGDRIAFLSPNDISYFELLFACAKMGAIFIPINYRLNQNEIIYILENAEASMVFYHEDLQAVADSVKAAMPQAIWIDLKHEYREWLAGSEKWMEDAEIALDDPWVMIYTGGTTGLPKGVVLSHKNILANALNTIVSWKISARDITYTILPLFHTGGLNAVTMPVLYAGGTAIIGKQFTAEETLRIVAEEKVTILLLVPTMHHMVIHSPLFATIDLSHKPIFVSGGAPCPLPIYDAYQNRGIPFKEGYGLTEAGPNNFYLSPEEAMQKKGSVGRAMIHNQVTLCDEQGEAVPVGEVGEIVIEGPHVFAYYWNNPEATAQTVKNGKLYTGDLGRCDEEGYFYIVGRKKEMIISGGENIYPLEIEKVLQNHPDISEAVAVGVPDEKWGEKVVAYVVLREGGEQPAAEQLIAYCHQYLARYKTPKEFIFLEEMPKTPVGKIDKKLLVASYSEQAGKK